MANPLLRLRDFPTVESRQALIAAGRPPIIPGKPVFQDKTLSNPKQEKGLGVGGPAPKGPLESEVYESVVRLLELAGCQVYRLSQVRASRQTPGIPDLWIFGPGKRFAWIEAKRPGGRLRAEQRTFRERCQERKIEHVVGGLPEVERLLVQWKLAEALPNGGIVLTPRRGR